MMDTADWLLTHPIVDIDVHQKIIGKGFEVITDNQTSNYGPIGALCTLFLFLWVVFSDPEEFDRHLQFLYSIFQPFFCTIQRVESFINSYVDYSSHYQFTSNDEYGHIDQLNMRKNEIKNVWKLRDVLLKTLDIDSAVVIDDIHPIQSKITTKGKLDENNTAMAPMKLKLETKKSGLKSYYLSSLLDICHTLDIDVNNEDISHLNEMIKYKIKQLQYNVADARIESISNKENGEQTKTDILEITHKIDEIKKEKEIQRISLINVEGEVEKYKNKLKENKKCVIKTEYKLVESLANQKEMNEKMSFIKNERGRLQNDLADTKLTLIRLNQYLSISLGEDNTFNNDQINPLELVKKMEYKFAEERMKIIEERKKNKMIQSKLNNSMEKTITNNLKQSVQKVQNNEKVQQLATAHKYNDASSREREIKENYQYKAIKCGLDCNKEKFLFVPKKQTKLKFFEQNVWEKFNVVYAAEKTIYYYLKWMVVMQLIDGECKIYSFDNNSDDILLANSGLHDIKMNELFILSFRNNKKQALEKWKMIRLMNADEIYNEYGIKLKDLPNNSRTLRKFTENCINKTAICNTTLIENYTNFQIFSTPMKDKQHREYPNNIILTDYEFHTHVVNAIGDINNKLIKIVIFNENKTNYKIEYVLKIKIDYRNTIGLIYELNENQLIPKSISIDCSDIINKSLLYEIPSGSGSGSRARSRSRSFKNNPFHEFFCGITNIEIQNLNINYQQTLIQREQALTDRYQAWNALNNMLENNKRLLNNQYIPCPTTPCIQLQTTPQLQYMTTTFPNSIQQIQNQNQNQSTSINNINYSKLNLASSPYKI